MFYPELCGDILTLFCNINADGSSIYYGPDSVHSAFEVDTCAVQLGLPTCSLWKPDELAFLKLLSHHVPAWVGGWCMVGIIAASMSTAEGAILAMGT